MPWARILIKVYDPIFLLKAMTVEICGKPLPQSKMMLVTEPSPDVFNQMSLVKINSAPVNICLLNLIGCCVLLIGVMK